MKPLAYTKPRGVAGSAQITIDGQGVWLPGLPPGTPNQSPPVSVTTSLVNDNGIEVQAIGRVRIPGGGSKTFGTSSVIYWRAGAVTFASDGGSNPTLRVGVKAGSKVATDAGPPMRAAVGASEFNVYRDLVGGTDTISANTPRTETMNAGTGFSVADNDLIAVCWHLTKPGAASQSIAVDLIFSNGIAFPACTRVTSGPTFTAVNHMPIIGLAFDDGTKGWLQGSFPVAVLNLGTGSIGNGNIEANLFTLPWRVRIDALLFQPSTFTAGETPTIGIWRASDRELVAGAHVDHNTRHISQSDRVIFRYLPDRPWLEAGVQYAAGIRANSASTIAMSSWAVPHADFLGANSAVPGEFIRAKSTGGGAFAVHDAGLHRLPVYFRAIQFGG